MSSETTDDADECKYVRDQPFTQECKEALRAAASNTEGVFTKAEYNRWAATHPDNLPSIDQIEREFGRSFYEVCNEIGVPASKDINYSNSNILSAIRQAASEVGEPLTRNDYQTWQNTKCSSYPAVETIHNRLSWGTACEKAGVRYGSSVKDEDIHSAIRRAAANQGEPLTVQEYGNWRKKANKKAPSPSTIHKRFGWAEACEQAGVSYGWGQTDN